MTPSELKHFMLVMQAIDLLSGKWKLVYTASSELAPLLALGKLPGVTVGDIEQTIFRTNKVENKVCDFAKVIHLLEF